MMGATGGGLNKGNQNKGGPEKVHRGSQREGGRVRMLLP